MKDVGEIAVGLSPKQVRILRAMSTRGPKKWRAIYRHAKVQVASADWVRLPFSIARPTLTGFEYLTPLGEEVRRHLEQQEKE